MKSLFLRYLVFIGIPFFIAKRIEKYFWKHASPELKQELNKKLKELPDTISESSKDALGKRGGGTSPFVLWLVRLVFEDFAIKVAIGGGVWASIWGQTADNAAGQLAKYGSAILSAPGKKFVNLYSRIKGIDPQHSLDIREILFDKELTNRDKLELLKIKLENVLKNLKGSKRRQFILFVIATILFSVNGNFALFGWFMDRLRALIGKNDDIDTIREYVIESYREFNAPLPEELADVLPEEIVKSITNIK
jgi:hypothetical protein